MEGYTSITVDRNDKSEATIKGEIPLPEIALVRPRVLKKLGAEIAFPGFRKGHVPEKILVERLGEIAILEEVAETAIAEAYPHIIEEHQLDVIGRPKVAVTRMSPGEPIGFSIEVALMPDVTLPDYKTIAAEVMKQEDIVEVTDKEVEDTIEQIRKERAKAIGNKPENAEELPEFNDALVKTLGAYTSVEDFKAKLREDIKKHKERQSAEKKRVEMGERIIKASIIPLPGILVESELDKMLAQMEGDIERMGLKFEDYLKHLGKSREDIRKEWSVDAEKRAKLQLILNKIASTENIMPDAQEVEAESVHLLEHYKDADPLRIRMYIESVLQNEAVFKFLEQS